MDVAREAIGTVAGGYGVIVARAQHSGRGRQGRSWISAHGAFMGTFIFPWPHPRARLAGYSLAVGVAVSDVLAARYRRREGIDPSARIALKWPNDIMVTCDRDGAHTVTESKKIAGILIEVAEHNGSVVLLVGLGLNILSAPDQVDTAGALDEYAQVPLTDSAGEPYTDPFLVVRHLLPDLAQGMRTMHERFIARGFASFREEWQQRSLFVPGQSALRIDIGEQEIQGIFEGVDPAGMLLVREHEGTVRSISSGHVVSWRL